MKKIIDIYNITQDRKSKQKNHQEICILLSILVEGPNTNYKDGVEIAKKFLEQRSTMFKADTENDLTELKSLFKLFNQFLLRLSSEIEYPFFNKYISRC